MAGAGAFVLNVQKVKSRAELMDGVDLTTRGKLEVKSANRTDATVKADSSATKSDTGVGVGIALNLVTMENIARIGTGAVEASELELSAAIAKAPPHLAVAGVVENASTLPPRCRRRSPRRSTA